MAGLLAEPTPGLVPTVCGPVPAASLGMIMPHEHVIFDIAQHSGNADNLQDDPAFMAEELRAFAEAGGGAVCDVTPIGLGRDVAALRAASAAAGVPVVSALGVYADNTWPSAFADCDEAAKTEYLVKEAEASGAAFLGEIATHNEPHADHRRYVLKPNEEEMLRAVGRAALRLGLTVSTHASLGRAGVEQLRVLGSVGVDLRRVIIGHCDLVAHSEVERDLEYYRLILETGATVEFDFFGW